MRARRRGAVRCASVRAVTRADPEPPTPSSPDRPVAPARPALVERAGRRYAAAAAALDVALADAVVVEAAPAPLDGLVVAAGASHLERLRGQRPAMHDGPVLALQSLDGHVVRAARTGYFAMIASCDAIRAELDAASASVRADLPGRYAAPGTAMDDLPLRAAVHAAAGGDPLVSGAGRAAGLGVSAVLTVPTPGGPAGSRSFVLGRRSADVAIDAGLWHVAPSGMLEALPGGALAGTVAVELAEEVAVEVAVEQVAARASVLGLVHDLTRLRPDLSVRLDLTAEEAAAVALPPGGEFDDLALIPLDAASMARFWGEHPPERLTPAAAGTLALVEQALVEQALVERALVGHAQVRQTPVEQGSRRAAGSPDVR